MRIHKSSKSDNFIMFWVFINTATLGRRVGFDFFHPVYSFVTYLSHKQDSWLQMTCFFETSNMLQYVTTKNGPFPCLYVLSPYGSLCNPLAVDQQRLILYRKRAVGIEWIMLVLSGVLVTARFHKSASYIAYYRPNLVTFV